MIRNEWLMEDAAEQVAFTMLRLECHKVIDQAYREALVLFPIRERCQTCYRRCDSLVSPYCERCRLNS